MHRTARDPAGESRDGIDCKSYTIYGDGEEALGRRGLVLCDNISGCQRCKGYSRVGLVCSSSTTGQVLCGEWPD